MNNAPQDDDVTTPAVFTEQSRLQKILVIIGYVCFGAAAFCGIYAALFYAQHSKPVFASLLASIVFFVGAGIVIQVMGKANLPRLKVEDR